jgi:hypothetical protein
MVKPATLQQKLMTVKAVGKFPSQYFLAVLAVSKFTDEHFTDGLWPPVNSSFFIFTGGFDYL